MTTQKDIEYLSAGVSDLENYLLSKELYYPIGANLPQLTLGGLLLSIARAGFKAESFRRQVDAIHSKWRAAWDVKMEREVKARSTLWMNYLAEYQNDRRSGAGLYAQNVRYRAMMTLLGRAEHDSDTLVKSVFKEDKFIWEEECSQNFPRDIFWYLFGTLKE